MASQDERRWIRDVLREHLAEHFPDLAAAVIDPAAHAALLCDYCLEVQPGEQVVVRSTTLGLAARCSRSSARCSSARRGRCCGSSLPGQEEAFWAAARDVHLDGFAPLELVEAEETDASIAIHAPENTRALAGVDPALHDPRRPRSGAGARGRAGAAVVRDGVADAGAGAGRGHVGGGLRGVRVACAVPRS